MGAEAALQRTHTGAAYAATDPRQKSGTGAVRWFRSVALIMLRLAARLRLSSWGDLRHGAAGRCGPVRPMLEAALAVAAGVLLCAAAAAHMRVERIVGSSDGLAERLHLPETASGLAASAAGLPSDIDATDRHVALFVSVSCPVCHRIVASFQGTVPAGLTVVVTDTDLRKARRWVRRARLQGSVVADDGSVAAALGIAAAPTAVGFFGGAARFALRLRGAGALGRLLEPGG